MKKEKIKPNIGSLASTTECFISKKFIELFNDSPILEEEKLSNLSLFMKRQDLCIILFMNEIYQKILDVHGVIMEFGVRWGRNLAIPQTHSWFPSVPVRGVPCRA